MAEGATVRRSQLFSQVRTTLRSASYRPPLLPTVAIKLWELARNTEAPLSEVRNLLEQDALIAGEVLRLAQSPLYSRGQPIESLNEAVMRLGAVQLSEIFLDVATRSTVFKSTRFQPLMEQLRRHSTCTAHMARALCDIVRQPGDRAFLCGLLHDAGIAGVLLVLEGLLPKDEEIDIGSLIPEIHAVHPDASTVLATRWNLPMAVRWILGHHHDYKAAGHVNPIAAVVCVADWLITEAGAPGPELSIQEKAQGGIDYFQINESNLARLKTQAQAIVEQHQA